MDYSNIKKYEGEVFSDKNSNEVNLDIIDNNELQTLIEKTTENGLETPVERYVKKREYWMDALRVYANYLVVLTHTANTRSLKFGSKHYFISVFYNCFSRTCVPLFIMISGILFLNPKKELSCKTMFSKYIFRIFKSYLFWTVYYNVFEENIFKYIYNNKDFHNYKKTISSTILNTLVSNHNHLWYLNFVIGLYMVTPIIKKITPDRHITWYTCILFSIISQLIPTLHTIFYDYLKIKEFKVITNYTKSLLVEISGSYIVYYLLGYLLNKEFSKKIYIYLSYIIGILGTLLTFALRCGYSLYLKRTDFYFVDFHCINVVMESIGTFVFFKYPVKKYIDKLIEYKSFKKVLITLSDCSFGIYLLHYNIIRILKQAIPNDTYNTLWWVPVSSFIIYFISFIIIYFIRKISLFREIT
ncbi:hypothetical protein BCR36DRAFT_342110 [Piromyces finnis]|uniref:Acyltransferase 3 domain-containing protein n=1 Tax=Piromyces finnis TaxID=1754191 RepID=A0A1Y1VM03_9FUNG|nr:hypothetical protein BCR36DRAFT_342110 [Piromyces finnis]|eukprot:ORX59953.1 hypothetical protein BCR36DRAFT_342110 [Piromyces finnis]